MGRTMEDWYRDWTTVSGVEQRVKDYKALIRELEDCIRTAEDAYQFFNYVSEDLEDISCNPRDASEGVYIDELEELSRMVSVKFNTAYQEIQNSVVQLKRKKEQAESQLAYYQRKSEYEDTLDRDLKPYEYNLS